MGDATLTLERRLNTLDKRNALVIGGNEPWTIANGGTTVVRCRPEEVVSFYCHGPRYGWPQFLAALVKNDLWIRRSSCP
jgi:hypothetical protein